MLVTIKGLKKEYRDLVRYAVWFYAEKLMSKTLVNTLELTINLTQSDAPRYLSSLLSKLGQFCTL